MAIRRQPWLATHTPDIIGRGSRSRFDCLYDDALAVAILADSNLPSLLIADFKIWFLLSYFRYWWYIQLLLDASEDLPVAW